jgi:hypothetical protein
MATSVKPGKVIILVHLEINDISDDKNIGRLKLALKMTHLCLSKRVSSVLREDEA